MDVAAAAARRRSRKNAQIAALASITSVAGPRMRVSAARILAHATVLASLAASASGIGGGLAPHEKLRSWYVAHGPRKDEERVFGYVADEEAMEPAMTISMRARASGETSDVIFVRRGTSVGVCNVDDEGLVLSF